MHSNRMLRAISAATLLICLPALTGCATVKTHPEFNERHASIKRLAILPPDTQVFEVTFNAGNKPLADIAGIVKKHAMPALSKSLKAKGYEVVEVSIEQKDLDADAALREAFFNIQALYKKATEEIAKGKKKTFTYDVGSSPNYFAEKHNVNALVITRQVGSKLSDGTVAGQVVSTAASVITTVLLGVSAGGGIQPRHTLATEIAIVDADLGDILWYHLGQTNENFTKQDDPKPSERLIDTILKPLPLSKFQDAKKTSPEESAKITDKKISQKEIGSVIVKNNFSAKKI